MADQRTFVEPMLCRIVVALLAAAPEPSAPLSPRWVPAQALRRISDELGAESGACPVAAWARQAYFHSDLRAGLTTPGLDDALLSLIADGTLEPRGGRWGLRDEDLVASRRAFLRLDPGTAAAVTRAAARWHAWQPPPARDRGVAAVPVLV